LIRCVKPRCTEVTATARRCRPRQHGGMQHRWDGKWRLQPDQFAPVNRFPQLAAFEHRLGLRR
jgi:hypothetical protein